MVFLGMLGTSIPLTTDLRVFGSVIHFEAQKYNISLQDFVLRADIVLTFGKLFYLTEQPISQVL